ncbi:DUF4157 domain-containing protein [Arenimonas terrae]|uniref:DUF4157 domain-containing protein n=1 Tax=Arenimonas terrae TaxID=2546226 RepID=A0A5C4RVW4_9GAMM|nr:DUF4157 domain-containing protein [Arenimonas terrae]TNJ35433.1 DUF4157 domain-containing protein [Arenimonas terrae]
MKQTANPALSPVPKPCSRAATVQRRCACGAPSRKGSTCSRCAEKKAQAKLSVSTPGDAFEREADRISAQVMAGGPAEALARPSPVRVQRAVGQAPTPAHGVDAASVDRALAGGGRALDAPVRHDMERRFGHSFSQVRVHTGDAAAESAAALGADAYTVGASIAFGRGKFAPGSPEGKRLLAHELTHVLQQSGTSGAATAGRMIFRHSADKTKCLGDPEWKRIDATPQEIYAPANDAIERAYIDSHGKNAVLTGSQFEYGGKPGATAIELPKGAPDKGSCNSLLKKFSGVSRQLAPDIMDCSERVFYEIKTNQYAEQGAQQILGYYKQANELTSQAGEPGWNIDLAGWYPPHVLMLEPTRRVCTEGTDYGRTQRPGLIIYEVQDHKDRKKKKEEEKKEKEKKDVEDAKQRAEEAALNKAKLKKVREFVDQLERELDLAEGENRMHRNLINNPSYSGFWGYWTNDLFSTQPPPAQIWDEAYSQLSGARIQLKAGNPEAALKNFIAARVAYFEAQKIYQAWRASLPGAAVKMQTAIGVTAILAVVAFVAPTAIARFRPPPPGSAASIAANLAKAESAVARLGTTVARGGTRIASKEAAIVEQEIITAAEMEAEMIVLRTLSF